MGIEKQNEIASRDGSVKLVPNVGNVTDFGLSTVGKACARTGHMYKYISYVYLYIYIT